MYSETCESERLEAHLRTRYGLVPRRLRLLARGGGSVYRVTHASGRAILKLFAPSFTNQRRLSAQMQFLNHLRKAGVAVSVAIPSLDGSTVGCLDRSPLVLVVLLEHARGRTLRRFTVDRAKRLGQMTARLHAASGTFEGLSSYPRLTPEWLIDEAAVEIERELSSLALSSTALHRAASRIRDDISRIPAGAERAICHGDLHYSNLSEDRNGTLTLFDFDHSRLAPVAFDLGFFCLLGTAERHWYQKLHLAFLQGYETVSHISEATLRLIPAMMAGFQIMAMGHHCRFQHTRYPPIDREYLESNVEALARYGTARSPYQIDGPPHRLLGGALDGSFLPEKAFGSPP